MGRRRQYDEVHELTLAEAHLHAQCDALDRRREFDALPRLSDEPLAEHGAADEGAGPPDAEDAEIVDVAALEREQLFPTHPRPQRRRRRSGAR